MAEPFSDEIARIKKGVDVHVSWLKEKTSEWESHSMGIQIKDIVMLLDTIAELKETNRGLFKDVLTLKKNLGEYNEMICTEGIKAQTIADQAATIWKLRSLIERWEKGFRGASVVDGVYRISAKMITDLLEQARKALDGKE